MATNTFDVGVVGDGIIAMSLIVKLLEKQPDLKILWISANYYNQRASTAAGAMLNCLGEIEMHTYDHPLHKEKYNIAREASDLWESWADKINSFESTKDELKVKLNLDGTWIVKPAINELNSVNETNNYQQIIAHLSNNNTSDKAEILDEGIYLPDERSIDARAVYKALRVYCEGKTTVIDRTNQHINKLSGCPKIVFACGAETQAVMAKYKGLLNDITFDPDTMLPVYYGHGQSYLMAYRDESYYVSHLDQFPDTKPAVIRTANRGMACGIHAVINNTKKQVCIGASNKMLMYPWPNHSIRTMKNIFDLTNSRLKIRNDKASVLAFQHGHRPISEDTLPLMGKISNKAFVMTGTKRDGFHCSPLWAELMADYVLSDVMPEKLTNYKPNRQPHKTFTVIQGEDIAFRYLQEYYPLLKDKIKLKSDITKYYNDLELTYGLPPEIFVMNFAVQHEELQERMA